MRMRGVVDGEAVVAAAAIVPSPPFRGIGITFVVSMFSQTAP
jgi:hypothetical protein